MQGGKEIGGGVWPGFGRQGLRHTRNEFQERCQWRKPSGETLLPDESRFLGGGDDSGAYVHAVDWPCTSPGAPQYWPRSLKTIVRRLRDSRCAMGKFRGVERR